MRVANRLIAVVASVALIVAAILFAIEVGAYRVGADPVLVDWRGWARWAQRTTWGAPPVRLTCAVLAGLGLILLLAQLMPRRPARLPVDTGNPATDAAVTRRGVAQAVRNAVTEVEGVHGADVAVNRRQIRILARSVTTLPATDVRERVADAAQDRVEALRLRHRPGVSVRVATREP